MSVDSAAELLPKPGDSTARGPFDERLFDLASVAMACWTILCNATVALGGSFEQLAWLSPLVAAALWVWNRFANRFDSNRSNQTASLAGEPSEVPMWLACLACLVAIAAIAMLHAGLSYRWVWGLLLAYFAVAAGMTPRHAVEPRTICRHRSSHVLVWAAAALCAVVGLTAHRADIDDGFYLNLSVAAVDAPESRPLASDTLHGEADLPLLLPSYRVHSIEMLIALASHVSGVSVIYVAHWLLPAVGGALCCLAWARLSRRLAPRHWPLLLLAVIGVFLFVGGPHRWYANFALVRMHQGKALLASVAVPAIISYAIDFMERANVTTWTTLAASQIAAMGASSTAIWLAPVVAGITLLATSPISWPRMATLAGGVLASAYSVTIGVCLVADMTRANQAFAIFEPPGDQFSMAWAEVLGAGPLRDAAVASLVLAWLASPTTLCRRLCLLFPLVTLAVFLNPLWVEAVIRGVTGHTAYWRVFWILPWPLFMAVVVAWPAWWPERVPRGVRVVCGATLAAALLFVIPPFTALSPRNAVTLTFPRLKVDESYAAAAALARHAERPARILAPAAVAAWVPTFHHHPYPLIARDHYLVAFAERGQDEMHRRLRLSTFIDGRGAWPADAALMDECLNRDNVGAVCFARSIPYASELAARLAERTFQPVHEDAKFVVWSRRPPRAARSDESGFWR